MNWSVSVSPGAHSDSKTLPASGAVGVSFHVAAKQWTARKRVWRLTRHQNTVQWFIITTRRILQQQQPFYPRNRWKYTAHVKAAYQDWVLARVGFVSVDGKTVKSDPDVWLFAGRQPSGLHVNPSHWNESGGLTSALHCSATAIDEELRFQDTRWIK